MRYIILSLLLGLGLTFSLLGDCDPRAVPPTAVSINTASHMLEKVRSKEWLLIDVRSPAEYAEGHIPGAINIPHDEIDHYLARLEQHQGKPIIIYCRSGRRAKLAMETLKKRAYHDVSHLEGDMMGWHGAGLPVDRM